MKTNYKNWVPKGMVVGLIIGTIGSLASFFIFGVEGLWVSGIVKLILTIIFSIIFIVCVICLIWCVLAYRAFSYYGTRQLSQQIISGIAEYIKLPEGGKGLDIGTGSGALAIACAKRNLQGTMIGVDRWGKEYASFNKLLCENNAKAEGVTNVKFFQGNAIKLDFEDESFDAVTSNYVYHNIANVDKQKLLLETLRTLKKGGVFAIHDLMSPSRYGDMQMFAVNLRNQGYEFVELIDTTKGKFMNTNEARMLMLKGSTLLIGKK
jgi:arsenite methyltransferase